MSRSPAVRTSTSEALDAAGAVVTPTSLTLTDPNISYEKYERAAAFIGQLGRACAWWAGDLCVAGEKVFGEEFAQIEQSLGLAPQTIANRTSVARHVPPSARRESLAFGTHAEVAYLEPKERDLWLDKAEKGGWTRARLREAMREERGETGPVDDLVVTGKNGDVAMRSPEGTPPGAPAAVFLGDPVPALSHCPHCGESLIIDQ